MPDKRPDQKILHDDQKQKRGTNESPLTKARLVLMREFGFQGTLTMLLFDRGGRLRRYIFDHIPGLQLGAELMALIHEGEGPRPEIQADAAGTCSPDGCS